MKKILDKIVTLETSGDYNLDIELYDCVGYGDRSNNLFYQELLNKGKDTHFMITKDETGNSGGNKLSAITPISDGKYKLEVWKGNDIHSVWFL